MPPNYGSLPAVNVPHTHGGRSKFFVRVAVAAVVASCLLATIAMLMMRSPQVNSTALLSSSTRRVSKAMLSEEEEDAPALDDMAAFQSKADAVLSFLGLSSGTDDESNTALEESCGDMLLPCLATVGTCAKDSVSTVALTQRLEVDPAGCECFSQGLSHFITLPDGHEKCEFSCLEGIANVFTDFLEEKNGDDTTSLACPRTFTNMAREVYGTDNDAFPAVDEADGGHSLPTGDEHVERAAKALQDHVNLIRKTECPLKARYTQDPKVVYDERGEAALGLGQYKLEVALGPLEEVFTGRVVHLPEDDQVDEPASDEPDGENLLGKFRVMRCSPDPCAEGNAASPTANSVLAGQLAVSHSMVRNINWQQLSWKAAVKPELEGVTQDQFGLGYIPPSPAERKAYTTKTADYGITEFPETFDARDRRADDVPCRAFDILGQGACGSCYAFAAASAMAARVCLHTERKWNVVVSPQEMMDCDNGCNGGVPFRIYKRIANADGFAVEDFCDPYQAEKQECGGTCSDGNKLYGLEGTAHYVGGPGEQGVRQIMKELLMNGPGVVAFQVYSDFTSYSEGVYTVSEGATKKGGHAVSLIGWGTEGGVDYWLIQNSWGKNAGDKGTWKIRRGTNEAGIEGGGMAVIRPEHPDVCQTADCQNGGVPMKDCSCRCHGGWGGAKCDECSLTCHNGGILADDCSRCYCPPGRFGEDCGGLATIDKTAQCNTDSAKITVHFTYGGGVSPPPQKSYVAFYDLDWHRSGGKVNGAHYVCGNQYDAAVNGGLCATSFSVHVNRPPEPGTFKLALIYWKPMNEFGQEGFKVKIDPEQIFALFTVTDDCSDEAIAAAASDNDLMAAFEATIASTKEAEKAEQAEMDARLDTAEKAVADLIAFKESQPEPSLEVEGMDDNDPFLFRTGGPFTICWVLPLDENLNPKHLRMYAGDGSSNQYQPKALKDQGPKVALPAASEGCVETAVVIGNPKEFTFMVMHGKQELARSVQFYLGKAYTHIKQATAFSADGNAMMRLKIFWKVSQATVSDTIVVTDSSGKVVTFFFTSSGNADEMGDTPSEKSEAVIEFAKPVDYVPGGLAVKWHPRGQEYVGDVARDWPNWSKMGW